MANEQLSDEFAGISWVEYSDWVLTPTQDRSKRTLQKVLTSARELFLAKSFETTTIAQISKRSGVSSGSIYNLFADKNAIFRALYEHFRITREGQIDTLIAAHDWQRARAIDIVRFHLDIIFSSSRDDVGFLRLLEQRRMSDPQLFGIQSQAEELFCQRMLALYQLRAGDFGHEDLKTAVYYVHFIIRGSALWSILPPHNSDQFLRVTDKRYQQETLRMACRYLGIDEAAPT
ncbi:transcriptional regulator, TetR family [Luminiphilus syltensis NOR5-1B]|uniref:Transcriptional regulator, TetR family n=1 Tax=Luminiphilus syltensis NOR5-1B TaxID=565045 RepID=B8KVH4_9GAMM|nr:TetR/AcrR family transcriptional regulator [Luminiphilus syltensis]EED36942.1 transcriptional regulator, TetR family [Luminiphilus syltensis NOR5-1B]